MTHNILYNRTYVHVRSNWCEPQYSTGFHHFVWKFFSYCYLPKMASNSFVYFTCVHFRSGLLQNGDEMYQIYNVVSKSSIYTHHPMKQTHKHMQERKSIIFAIKREKKSFTALQRNCSSVLRLVVAPNKRREKRETKRAHSHWFKHIGRGNWRRYAIRTKMSKIMRQLFLLLPIDTMAKQKKHERNHHQHTHTFSHSNRFLFNLSHTHIHWFKWIAMSCGMIEESVSETEKET